MQIKHFIINFGLIGLIGPFGFGASLSLKASELPDMGHASTRVLTPKEAHQIGSSVFRTIQSSKKWLHDSLIEDYIHQLGYRLVAVEKNHTSPYRFFVLQDNSLNAFALPGGYIGLHTGLITTTESESELAGVMAHEIAHVKLHHIARMYEHMGRMQLSTLIGMIASIILATQSAEAGSGAMAATLAGRQQALINYTRDHEKEADHQGMVTLVKAGFDPQGMPSLFQRMYQDTRYYGSHIPEYLLTHPLTQHRLFSTKEHAQQYHYKQIPDSLEYHLVRARVQAYQFSDPLEGKYYFATQLKKGTYKNLWAAKYGLILSLLQAGDGQSALKEIRQCENTYPSEPHFIIAHSQAQILLQNPQKALQQLKTGLDHHPLHRSLIYKYSEMLLQQKHYEDALSFLKQKQAHLSNIALISDTFSFLLGV